MSNLNCVLKLCENRDAEILSNFTVPPNNFSAEYLPFKCTFFYNFSTTSVIILIMLDILVSVKCNNLNSTSLKFHKWLQSRTLASCIAFIIFLLISPLIVTFFLIAFIYKLFCLVLIKRKDKYFAGFLDSFDVFWCLEDDVSKNTIDVLGVIETNLEPEIIVKDIKLKIRELLLNENVKKMFYRRYEDYGFYYWRRNCEIDLDQYVEIVDLENETNSGVSAEFLERMMSEVWKQPLPYEDEGLFKVIITKQRINRYKDQTGEYGIIMRIHHSVGDGIALIELLCNTIADQDSTCPIKLSNIPSSRIKESPHKILAMMQKLCKIPQCLIKQSFRKDDKSSLHGMPLVGNKIFKWTKSDENLLQLIKEIRFNIDQLKLSDILLTALVGGLRNYFSKTNTHIPEEVAVVLPIRFPKSSRDQIGLKLENDFSVAILDLPMNGSNKMKDVKSRCDKLRNSAAPWANYYFIKLVSNVLHKDFLQIMLYSGSPTLVFSNIPGPDHSLRICGGTLLKNLVFFVPNKGSTGVGVTALTYGGVLRLAVVADTGLISNCEDLSFILDGMVDEIKMLHKQYVHD